LASCLNCFSAMPPNITIPASLKFEVVCADTAPGETVAVVGSCPELGEWDPKKGLELATEAQVFPSWFSPAIPIHPDKIFFKVVITGPKGVRWEGGDNKPVQLYEGKRSKVKCSFGSEDFIAATSVAPKDIDNLSPAPELINRPKPAVEEKPMGGYNVQEDAAKEQPLKEETDGTTEQGPPLQKRQSRHLFQNSDGSLNMQMSRTASLMLVDMDEFCAEAEAEESHLVELERERLNMQQRRVASATLLEEMAKITEYADPSHTVMLQGFNWESHKAGKGNWYGIVESKVDMLADMGITDIWLPPCSQSVAPQGYLPSQLFNLDASAYGKKAALKSLLKALHAKGMRGVADIVINHRCGDKQDEQGRWNVFTSTGIESRKSFHGIMDWQGWAITLGDQFSDGTGERGPGHYDGKFDAAPDIDHGNKKVQGSIAIWLRWLRLDIGFDAWRFDFVKGYGAEYVGHYCKKSEPSWAVGELWLDMEYDHDGLKYNQDKHRQDTVNWINGTDKESTAFDFTTKGILQEAVRNTQYWRLKDSNGKPPGLLGWMPTHAVTFLDNHDTGSTQAHWPFPNDKVLVGYAYILTHPGIPCIFWDHICDWGEDMRNRIKALLQLRRRAGIKVDDKVQILCADHDLYIAEIGSPPALRVALGPKHSGVDGAWSPGTEGADYRVWISQGK